MRARSHAWTSCSTQRTARPPVILIGSSGPLVTLLLPAALGRSVTAEAICLQRQSAALARGRELILKRRYERQKCTRRVGLSAPWTPDKRHVCGRCNVNTKREEEQKGPLPLRPLAGGRQSHCKEKDDEQCQAKPIRESREPAATEPPRHFGACVGW
jgi:hypothetical protein